MDSGHLPGLGVVDPAADHLAYLFHGLHSLHGDGVHVVSGSRALGSGTRSVERIGSDLSRDLGDRAWILADLLELIAYGPGAGSGNRGLPARSWVVTGIMVISWLAAPLHDRPVLDLLELSEHLSIVVYCISFWVFLGWSLVKMSRTCLRRGRTFRHDDPARSVSLLLIGIAGVAAVPVVILWSSSILIEHVTGREATQINAVGDAMLPWPVLLNALGVLSLLTVPYLVELSKTRLQWRHLRTLWMAMIARYPEVHLPLRPTGGPLARMQTRLERAIIEIHDALRLTRVDTAKAPNGLPIETVAAALRGTECGTRSAADILEQSETREADVRQLISLARAYEMSR